MVHLQRQLCAALRTQLRGGKVLPPEAGLPLWDAFLDLSGSRTYHAAGPNPIQMTEIAAYCRMMRLPLEPRHVSILMAMDGAWLDHAYSGAKTPEGVKALPPVSTRPISAALLDAVLG
ncbi:hypothetical protein D2T31_10765 [Sinirhodobacter populi]|uniref:Uncharacterized protein n=1 Tax=Paenirhodobacter populi TaxID=2306993 RepID=A0A443K9P6_9RHOB|nr:hypothetical protein D2T31_10765 [Sinirhodobacter populi]